METSGRWQRQGEAAGFPREAGLSLTTVDKLCQRPIFMLKGDGNFNKASFPPFSNSC